MSEIRRERLQRLIDERFDGVQSAACHGLSISTGYLNDLLRGRAPFGERTARRIEQAAGLTDGWLDKKRGDAAPTDVIDIVVDGRVAMTLPAGSAITFRFRKS